MKKSMIAVLLTFLTTSCCLAGKLSASPTFQFQDVEFNFPGGYKGVEIKHLSSGPLLVIKYGEKDREETITVTDETNSITDSEIKAGCTYNSLLHDVFDGTYKSKCKSERIDLMKKMLDRSTYKKKWSRDGFSFFYETSPGVSAFYVTNPEGNTYMLVTDIFELEDLKPVVVTN